MPEPCRLTVHPGAEQAHHGAMVAFPEAIEALLVPTTVQQ
jgi:hypothetical protein